MPLLLKSSAALCYDIDKESSCTLGEELVDKLLLKDMETDDWFNTAVKQWLKGHDAYLYGQRREELIPWHDRCLSRLGYRVKW
jgi:hypothetical protein